MTVMMIITLVCVVAVAVLLVALIRIDVLIVSMMRKLIQQDTETVEVLDLMATQLENMVREIQKMKYNQNRTFKPWLKPGQTNTARYARRPTTQSTDDTAGCSGDTSSMTESRNASEEDNRDNGDNRNNSGSNLSNQE